jgi:hypothetical protein
MLRRCHLALPWDPINNSMRRSLKGNFGDPQDIEATRFRLANAILSIAQEDSRNVEALKHAALQRMALDLRQV